MITKLTPEELQILKGTNKQMFKYFVLPILGIILLILLLSLDFDGKKNISEETKDHVKLTTNK